MYDYDEQGLLAATHHVSVKKAQQLYSFYIFKIGEYSSFENFQKEVLTNDHMNIHCVQYMNEVVFQAMWLHKTRGLLILLPGRPSIFVERVPSANEPFTKWKDTIAVLDTAKIIPARIESCVSWVVLIIWVYLLYVLARKILRFFAILF